jgi:hypothetical protein
MLYNKFLEELNFINFVINQKPQSRNAVEKNNSKCFRIYRGYSLEGKWRSTVQKPRLVDESRRNTRGDEDLGIKGRGRNILVS